MWSCIFRASQVKDVIKAITSNGGVMELYPTIITACITNEFLATPSITPAISSLSPCYIVKSSLQVNHTIFFQLDPREEGFCETTMIKRALSHRLFACLLIACLVISIWQLEKHPGWWGSKHNNVRVWKVKLVITQEQLREILSQESRTEALNQSMRNVAKCGSGAPSRASSDKWSSVSSLGNRVAHILWIRRQIKQMTKGHDKI